MAEDREQFETLLDEYSIDRPPNGIAINLEEAQSVAADIGYPVLVRPSFVLGGRAMAIVYDEDSLANYVAEAIAAAPNRPILIDHYLEDTFEVDVDAICDGERVVIGGIIEHIEARGARDKYRVLVGGGSTTQEWADSIGADGYGRTAGDAATLAMKVISQK